MDGEPKVEGSEMRETEANQNIDVNNAQINTEAKKPQKSTTLRGFDPFSIFAAAGTLISSILNPGGAANTPVNYNPELGPPTVSTPVRAQDTKITGVDVTESQKMIDAQMRDNKAWEKEQLENANAKTDKFHQAVLENQKKTGYTGEPTSTPTPSSEK